jgi:hypothetical protein
MDMQVVIKELEKEWDLDIGFLGGVRQENFRIERLERLVNILKSIDLSETKCLDKRLVSLIWYIPIFLMWQKERYIEQGRDAFELEQAINQIEELLEHILGIP